MLLRGNKKNFIIYKGFKVAKNSLRPERVFEICSLKTTMTLQIWTRNKLVHTDFITVQQRQITQ